MAVTNYRDLIAWQRSMELVPQVYELVKLLPTTEHFGLASQLRRAAVSIPVNIAEGEGRNSRREFRRFLAIAHGSLREVETEVLIAVQLKYTSDSAAQHVLTTASEVGRLINGLRRALSE